MTNAVRMVENMEVGGRAARNTATFAPNHQELHSFDDFDAVKRLKQAEVYAQMSTLVAALLCLLFPVVIIKIRTITRRCYGIHKKVRGKGLKNSCQQARISFS
jgi:hypothetical protein